jgi:hypothetical protein
VVLVRWRHLFIGLRTALGRPLILFALTALLMLTAVLSFEVNFGVIVRHRSMVLPFLFLFLSAPRRAPARRPAPAEPAASTALVPA